ncbi:SWIM zinc finger family protein [Kribbella sp. NPDC051952]|uniref:SWIM zinc finger family protein n=1 Tax=Kribbella sp. NPDC051952 TaxID=3154851 RepID=UPI00342C4A50
MSAARGFVAFGPQRRSTRGRSWWARAWVQALEDTSLDLNQLKKGRRYASSGQVGPITISAGRIGAMVYSPDDTYEAVVRVDQLSEDAWRRFLDQVAERSGHIAALLDGDMPHDLVEAAADAGVPLLPGIGDLDPSCTCDAWELPCQHAAALCYQVAWLLDDDPFILLLLRGQAREDLLDQLQARSQSRATDQPRPTEPGVALDDVLGTPVGELPEAPNLPAKITLDDLPVSGIEPPPGFAPTTLPLLVLDAARRARALLHALLHGTPEPQPLDEWADAVRLAADFPELTTPLAEATGRSEELARGIQAWRYGGAAGLDVLEHTWSPDPAELARARTELLAADDDLTVETTGNQLTLSNDLQLRLDRRGRWHPYRLVDDTWTPSAQSTTDPLAALTTE